jgi:hypothetical protein
MPLKTPKKLGVASPHLCHRAPPPPVYSKLQQSVKFRVGFVYNTDTCEG